MDIYIYEKNVYEFFEAIVISFPWADYGMQYKHLRFKGLNIYAQKGIVVRRTNMFSDYEKVS